MARRTRMIGVAGLLALAAGFALAAPVAADTPTGTVTQATFGNVCSQDNSTRDLRFDVNLNWAGIEEHVPVTITRVQTSGAVTSDLDTAEELNPVFNNDLVIETDQTTKTGHITAPGTQGSVTVTVTIETAEDDPVTLPSLTFGPYAACATGGATTSSTTTSSTSSTTSTTTGPTTSTTAGATTTTVAGTTTTTSTTLGPNDTTGSLTVSPTTITQGGSFTVSGTGFAPNVSVAVTLFSDPISVGTLQSNASGAISGSLTMPASAPAGAHKLEAKGANAANGNNILSANVQVTARTGTTIARTGDSADLLLPIGVAVVSFGILAFAWRERRLTQA